MAALVVAALSCLAYAALALIERRAIFAALATEPGSVGDAAARRSDLINTVLFLASGVLVAIAAALLVGWLSQLRRNGYRSRLRAPWFTVVLAGVVTLAVALTLHTSEHPDRIVLGYLVLGIAALVLALAAAWGAWLVGRTGRDAVAGDPAGRQVQWPVPRS